MALVGSAKEQHNVTPAHKEETIPFDPQRAMRSSRWYCCERHRGRAKCPLELPVMQLGRESDIVQCKRCKRCQRSEMGRELDRTLEFGFKKLGTHRCDTLCSGITEYCCRTVGARGCSFLPWKDNM